MAALTIPRLRPNTTFVDSQGNLTLEGYRYLDGLYLRVGGSLDSLNAVTLADKTWDAPNPIGSTTPNTGAFTTLTATTLSVSAVSANSPGIKHKRLTTGSIPATTSALVTCTWTTPFVNTNYTVTATVQDSTSATASLVIVHIETIATGSVVVRVSNTSASAITGTLHVIAMHD